MSHAIDPKYKPITMEHSNLFKPVQVGGMQLKQRVVMAPLTRGRATDDNTPNKDGMAVEYYGQRSQAPGTLIITESSYISEQAGGYANVPGLYNNKQMAAWKHVFDKIHENESYVFVQLWSMGNQADPVFLKSKNAQFLGPVDNLYPDEQCKNKAIECGNELKGMTHADIEQSVADYVQAAKNAVAYGADGVEIQAGNGYLLNQFLDPVSNKRSDKYGGSIENRSRFVLEVVDAVIAAVGAAKVGIRFSPFASHNGMSGRAEPLIVAQYSHLIGELEKRAMENLENRLAYIHLREPRVPLPNQKEIHYSDPDYSNNFVFTIWKGIVIRSDNYGLDNHTALEDANANDRTLLAYGRYFISNPDLVYRLKHMLPLTMYDRSTFYKGVSSLGYTDYPCHLAQSS
ncbi:hypothetical protein ACO0QE_000005 [Hanseniaspora vineae]